MCRYVMRQRHDAQPAPDPALVPVDDEAEEVEHKASGCSDIDVTRSQ